MEVLVCDNNSSRTTSPFMVKDCVGKLFTMIIIARQRVWENHLRGTKSPKKVKRCLGKLLWSIYWELQ